jgi:hypothetical protein
MLVHAALVAYLAITVGPTCDEPFHLAAGVRRFDRGAFDLDLGNPPLVGTVAALPLLFTDVKVDWRHVPDSVIAGHDFSNANGVRFFALLSAGRLACLPFSLLGAWVCFRWASRLHGAAGGLLALALWCFCPNVLAHAALVTGDVAATAVGLAAFYSLWKWHRQPSWHAALTAGVWFGVAQLSKYLWVVLYAAWPAIWLAWRMSARRSAPWQSWRTEALQMASMLLVGICLTNVGYLFDGSFAPLGSYPRGRRALAPAGAGQADAGRERGAFGRWAAAIPVPFPSPYLRGIDEIGAWFDRPHQSYLRGRWSANGWWYYYLYGLAVKVPLGTWLIVLAACLVPCFDRHVPVFSADELFLLTPCAIVLCFVTASSSYQSHVRYVLPALPFVFVWATKLALVFAPLRWSAASIFTVAALSGSVTSSLAVYPHCLSYFNELAGGSRRGDMHLIDSNIDWGQDLWDLRDWLDQHPEAGPLHLAYFGGVDAQLAGISYTLPTRTTPNGWYAISVNFLHGLPFGAPNGEGGWQPISAGQFSRFQKLVPIGRAGYSIKIYQVGTAAAENHDLFLDISKEKKAAEERSSRRQIRRVRRHPTFNRR